MTPRPWLPVVLALLLVPPGALARAADAPAGGESTPLAGQIDGMVDELLADAKTRKALQAAGRNIAFEGVAWRSEQGTLAGTSPLGLQLDDAVSEALTRHRIPTTPAGIRTRGLAGLFVKGAFGVVGSTAKVMLSFVDQNTGKVVSEVRRTLQPSALMNLGVNQLLPPDSENARMLAQLIQGVVGAGAQPFPIQVRTARGAHAAYFEGEHLQVVVETDRDCYLRLYHISWAERTLTMIYPNRSEPNPFIHAGAPVQLPAPGSAAVFEIAKPYGVDAIVAIASDKPFADDALVRSRLEAPEAAAPQIVSEPVASAAPTPPPAEAPAPPPAPAESSAPPTEESPASEPTADGAAADSSLQRTDQFLSESGIDEARTRGVLTRGLIVRHLPGGSSQGASGSTSITGLSVAAGVNDGARVAKAVCYFTTLPKITFSR